MTARTNSKSPLRKKNGDKEALLLGEKLDSSQEVQSQPKDTTSPKYLLLVFLVFLVLFSYFTGQINGLIVATGLVAYFFYGKSDNREIPLILKKIKKRKKTKIVSYRCPWHNGCSGPETAGGCYCKDVVIEFDDSEDDS